MSRGENTPAGHACLRRRAASTSAFVMRLLEARWLAVLRESCHLRRVEKKRSLPLVRIHAYAEKLRFLPHLSEDERYLYAYQLAATPDERWRRSQNYLRSVLSSRPLRRKK